MSILSATVRTLKDWLKFAFFTLLVFVVVRILLLEAFTIPTSSMENTLLVGDFLLVNKSLYGAEVPGTHLHLPAVREPERGDVVVFHPPHDPERNYVKRVVGIPGDTLSMREKVLLLNGAPQEEEYVRFMDDRADAVHPDMAWQSDFLAAAHPPAHYHPSRDNWGPLVVPAGKYFVLGDNRDNSEDSRYWGFVDREAIRGHPWLVYLSFVRDDDPGEGWFGRVRWRRIGHRIR